MALLFLLFTILLLAVFILHSKIIRLIAWLTQFCFFIGFLGMLSTILLSNLYYEQTDDHLQETYLGQQLKSADATLNEVSALQADLTKNFSFFFDEEQNKVAPSVLYPSFAFFIGTGLLVITSLFSLFLMLLGIYFRYALVGYLDSKRNIDRIRKLEEQLGLSR